MLQKIYICYIIIIALLLLNLYITATLLEGNWETTEDFTDRSQTKIFMNIRGKFYTDCRIIFIKDEPVVSEGHMIFIGQPLGCIFMYNCGIVYIRGFDDIFPRWLYYRFDPTGSLILKRDKIYGEFTKI